MTVFVCDSVSVRVSRRLARALENGLLDVQGYSALRCKGRATHDIRPYCKQLVSGPELGVKTDAVCLLCVDRDQHSFQCSR